MDTPYDTLETSQKLKEDQSRNQRQAHQARLNPIKAFHGSGEGLAQAF